MSLLRPALALLLGYCSSVIGHSAAVPGGDYPDEPSFQERRAALLSALATNDLDTWRRGYFTGGDPGKYLPGPAMAKLLADPADPAALRLMNDDRSPREHYHFAALNWSRFIPLFGDKLTPATRATLEAEAARYTAYLTGGGTENHKTMWLLAANLLPQFFTHERFSGRPRGEAAAVAKEQLRAYIKNLYVGGQGEWDSPTYLMFTVHGLLNLHDFSTDPDIRLLASAGLDFLVASQALKYRDGLFTGPNQRGYYDRPYASIADQSAWLWWSGSATPAPADLRRWFYAIHPATSTWRPDAVLTAIARKQLPGLPVTYRNTRANYWHGLNRPVFPDTYRENLHLSRSFTLGSLDAGHGSQLTRIHLTTIDSASTFGPLALTGGHPRKSDHTGQKLDELTYRDGGGRYDQAAQFGPLLVNLTRLPDDEAVDHVFVSLPAGVTPSRHGERWVLRVGDTWVCVVPLGGQSAVTPADLNPRQIAAREKAAAAGRPVAPIPSILRITGRPLLGFALLATEASEHPDAEAFLAWMDNTHKIDAESFSSTGALDLTLPDGSTHTVRHVADADRASVEPPLPAPKGPFSGPFVTLQNSVLTLTDGTRGYTVDFTGDLPVYRPLP